VTNKIELLRVEEKVKLIREIEYEKRKTAMCQEFCLVSYKIQIFGRTEPNY
jgi:hypothetical protein